MQIVVIRRIYIFNWGWLFLWRDKRHWLDLSGFLELNKWIILVVIGGIESRKVKNRNKVLILHVFNKLLVRVFRFRLLQVAGYTAKLKSWCGLWKGLLLWHGRRTHSHHLQEVQIDGIKTELFFLFRFRYVRHEVRPMVEYLLLSLW